MLHMQWILLTIGVLLSLVGVVWMLQGLDQLGGSPMSGQPFWAWSGLVTLISGLVVLYAGYRIKARRS